MIRLRMATFGCVVAATALLGAGCATTAPSTVAAAGESGAIPRQLGAGQVVVTLAAAAPGHWDRITADLASAHDLPQVGAFPLTSIGVQCVVFQVPEGRAIDEVVRRLAADPRVESIQPNQMFHGLAPGPNDPYASFQYGAYAIRAPLAHRWATGRGVTVAVIDTGMETEHPDLHGRIVKTANFVEGGQRTFGRDRHGTAVAGVIAARVNNDVGIFGVAPETDLLAIKACWHGSAGGLDARCSSWTLAKALDFAVNGGSRVLNLSLGGPPDPLLARLIDKAVDRGVTVIAAAMEGANAPGFPASLSAVIGVVASDPQNEVRSDMRGVERHHPAVLAAPGVEILTTAPRQAYAFLSGTSLAAAHVSGVVALLLERDPLLSPTQVRGLLFSTARPVTARGAATVRLVDACAALARLVGGDSSACEAN